MLQIQNLNYLLHSKWKIIFPFSQKGEFATQEVPQLLVYMAILTNCPLSSSFLRNGLYIVYREPADYTLTTLSNRFEI